MKFLMFGAPMAGKGTLANMLSEEYGLPTISMGDILRGSIARGDAEGVLAKSYMDQGKMVPNEVVCAMIKTRLAKDDVQNGFILDGFPRTPDQLKVFIDEKITDIDVVVSLEVPYEALLSRVVGRRTCKDCGYIYNTSWGLGYEKCPKCGGEWGIRSDDNEETYKTRYDVYNAETLPILDYFKGEGKVVTVQGQSEPEQSYENMLKAFKSSDIAGLKEFVENK
ncbi:MAG: nucleoside monophosphate kinase [Clostridia bacterium]|nr:nucleoside monophosphate kinase [Clostridia bacterium]